MSDEFKLQWSVSLAPVAQYAKGHMFNFRGNTVEELNSLFDEVLAADTIDKALSVAELLAGAQVVKESTGSSQSESKGSNAPDEGNTSSGNLVRMCKHGKRQRRSGTKNGNTWVGWFCPTDRGTPDQCKPDFEDNR